MAMRGLGREDWVMSVLLAVTVLVGGWLGNKKPRPCGAGFCDSAPCAYAPDRPAPVGEVIRASTRMLDAAGASGTVGAAVSQCSTRANYASVARLVQRNPRAPGGNFVAGEIVATVTVKTPDNAALTQCVIPPRSSMPDYRSKTSTHGRNMAGARAL